MSDNARQNLKMVAIAVAASLATAAAPAIAHGVQHALFAHKAGVANNAKKLGGKAPSAYQGAHRRLKVVRSGGTASANGTALRQAMSGISGASSTNRWMLFLEPGVYNIGSNPIRLKQFVDLRGSGKAASLITCACGTPGNSTADQGATLWGMDSTGPDPVSISDLTVRNTGGSAHSHAINLWNFGTVHVDNVRLAASGATSAATGLWISQDSSVVVTHSHLVGEGGAANYGAQVGLSDFEIRDSRLEAHGPAGAAVGYGISSNNGAGNHVTVIDSSIDSSGSADMYLGVSLNGGFATIRGSEVVVAGPASSTGLSFFAMASAHAGRVLDTRVSATGPGNNTGISAGSSPAVLVESSQVSASDRALDVGPNATLDVNTTMVDGPFNLFNGSSILRCFQNYNATMSSYSCV